jgi:predicted acyl esterase
MRRWISTTGAAILSLGLIISLGLAVAVSWVKLPGEEITPAGTRASRSIYVKMHDGVEIAVSVYLPPDLKAGEKVPVLTRTTR